MEEKMRADLSRMDNAIEISFDEFDKGRGFPRMVDHLEKITYPYQQEIAEYLFNAEVLLWQVGYERDCFTQKWVPRSVGYAAENGYMWHTRLAWYVENYNLRLPETFEQYILSQIKKGG